MKIKKFTQLNESIYNDSTFKTILTQRDVDINKNVFKNYDINLIDYIDVKNCIVYWDHKMDLDNQGINTIEPTITNIKIEVYISAFPNADAEDTETYGEEIIFNNKNSVFIIDDLHYINEKEYKVKLLPYSPNELDIVFKDEKFHITIVF